MRFLVIGLALSAVLVARGASAAWVVDGQGACVRTWTAESLLRGPAALANAPLLPFRSAAGGAIAARDTPAVGSVRKALVLGPMLTVAGGAMALVDTGVWVVTGLADTMTGGYFECAPDDATILSVDPVAPAFAANARPAAPTPQDRCGRPVAP